CHLYRQDYIEQHMKWPSDRTRACHTPQEPHEDSIPQHPDNDAERTEVPVQLTDGCDSGGSCRLFWGERHAQITGKPCAAANLRFFGPKKSWNKRRASIGHRFPPLKTLALDLTIDESCGDRIELSNESRVQMLC